MECLLQVINYKMKKYIFEHIKLTLYLFFVLFTVVGIQNASAQEIRGHYKQMHMVSVSEMNRKAEIGNYFQSTADPLDNVESLAEFEPMSGVLIAYPFELPYDLIADIAQKDTLYVICKNTHEEHDFRQRLSSYTYDSKLIKIIYADTDSHWTRDYAPMFVAGSDSIGIVNFVYNRPRPDDDKIPEQLSERYGFPYYSMSVVHTGGNYMTDGYGVAASTTIVYSESEEKGISNTQVDQLMSDYLGIHTYHVLNDPNNTYIDHIDCWGKFLDVDKVMIRSVPEEHPQYDEIEGVSNYFKTRQSSWGNNYQVYRVYTPGNQPYTNALILNNRVFVPLTSSQWDDGALEAYREAMPGYEVSGYYGSWESTDALHCRTHEMADKQMLRIKHYPVLGIQEDETGFTIEANIKAYSGEALYSDSLLVYYRVDNGEWQSEQLLHQTENSYAANLPAFEDNQEVAYYIKAVDQSGRRAYHPFIGEADPHEFEIDRTNTGIISGLSDWDIQVYPNPVSDYFYISASENYTTGKLHIELYAFNGQRIPADKSLLSPGKWKISTLRLPEGIYLLKVSNEEALRSFKIVKK